MQDHTHPSLVPAPSHTGWYLVLALFTFIVVASLGLASYNMYLSGTLATKNTNLADINQKISEISLDRNVVIANIITSNTIRPSIDLVSLVNAFRNAAPAAHVRLKGFSVKNDVVTTTLISTEPDLTLHPDPTSMIIKMMREYDTAPQYFTLDPILSIS